MYLISNLDNDLDCLYMCIYELVFSFQLLRISIYFYQPCVLHQAMFTQAVTLSIHLPYKHSYSHTSCIRFLYLAQFVLMGDVTFCGLINISTL